MYYAGLLLCSCVYDRTLINENLYRQVILQHIELHENSSLVYIIIFSKIYIFFKNHIAVANEYVIYIYILYENSYHFILKSIILITIDFQKCPYD